MTRQRHEANSAGGDSWGIHWFRRDLRIAGNPALRWSWKEHSGRVLGVFFFDSKFLSRPDFSHNRFAFFMETMACLRRELRESGGDLLVLDHGPDAGFETLLEKLKQHGTARPASVSWNRDYEPFARERDARIQKLLETRFALRTHTERDHLLIEPHEISKGEDGGFYQVYSPFARRWFDQLATADVQARVAEQKKGLRHLHDLAAGRIDSAIFSLTWEKLFGGRVELEDSLERFQAETAKKVTIPIPPAGSLAAHEVLRAFRKKVDAYGEKRDFPAIEGTSKLSMYFKNGSITPGQVVAELGLEDVKLKNDGGRTKFLKEIVWREFYYHVLWHQPRVENEAFLAHYKDLDWENDPALFDAWKQGCTGYPIVDAGMRELKATGWMHNRVRMIVASFLTKDLLIDWRWGERYFMEQLLDGDLAPNNGGWQWAASTGCDPQPYFRIFNPKLQGEKFDPEGEYVKRWVPELRHVPIKQLHEPGEAAWRAGYPKPVVNHASRKVKALALYKRSE